MSGIYAASSATLVNWLEISASALANFTEIYRFYHLDLLAILAMPLLLLLAGLMYYYWYRQRDELIAMYGIARIDPLTHLGNRQELNDTLLRELSRARRYQTDTSVLMIDIDHFKSINDLYGKKIGDRVILHTARIISNCLRLSDTLGRFGGEEFMVILPHTSQEEALLVAERIRQTVQNCPLVDNAEPIAISVSIGAAAYNNDIDTPLKLIHHSDQALYCAKHGGRNQVQGWAVH